VTRTRFASALTAIVLGAIVLRGLFPAADPPWRSTVGVVWHDEGAWVHNARNKALFGEWRQDEWNPVFIAPVFTALEYASFKAFGVGVRQARLVSEAAGVLSVILLALGLRRLGGERAGLIAGALLATNYVYVMYDRAAIMEALMAAFIVASWYCSTRAERSPRWGALAGVMATLAFFTKASAAFYVGALGLVVLARLLPLNVPPLNVPPKGGSYKDPSDDPVVSAFRRKSSMWTLAGLAVSFGVIAAVFVLPHWDAYWFYNWQVSVTRKPSYDPASVLQRVTWFPILHDTFSRMWGVLFLGIFGAWGILARWRRAADAERLLLLWVVVGSLELLLHDVSNERRFVFLIPGLVALASLVVVRGSLLPAETAQVPRSRLLLLAPGILYSAYVLSGPLARMPFLEEVYAHGLRHAVRLASATGLVLGAGLLTLWPRLARASSRRLWSPEVADAMVALFMAWNLAQFAEWALHRSYKNYDASVALGRALPPDTLVQGKLANGLALENRIRPVFIGHQFGNYADRKQRWDVRYILTYTDPEIGHEGDQIVDVLAAYPGWQIIMTFDVAETRSGHDKAALIEKRARH
jgi:hypothetical protein